MITVVRSGMLRFFSPSLSHTLSFSSSSFLSIPNPPKPSLPNPLSRSISTHASFETQLFIPPGIQPDEVDDSAVLPGSNIAVGPYAGDSKIKDVEFVKSSSRAKDCPRDDRPEFAVLGRSNVGKSSLINSLVRKREIALTSKKPG